MSAFPSNTLITSVLGLVTTGTPYLALYTSNPTAADSGTELTGGSYVRKAITFGSITAGAVSNSVAISFTNIPTANITHWGVRSALSGGDLRVFGPLSAAVGSISGDEITFPIGQLQIALAGS